MRLHLSILLAFIGLAITVTGGDVHPTTPSNTVPQPEKPLRFDSPEVILDGSLRLYPAFADIDGDGKTDMVVGTWLGRLRVYCNRGTNARPEYAKPTWLDDARQRALGLDLAVVLAELHRVDVAPFAEAGLGRPGGYLARQLGVPVLSDAQFMNCVSDVVGGTSMDEFTDASPLDQQLALF